MHLIVLAIGFGLVTASVLALASVGLTLQFGVTNYVNFAFGDFLTVGAYLAWVANVERPTSTRASESEGVCRLGTDRGRCPPSHRGMVLP